MLVHVRGERKGGEEVNLMSVNKIFFTVSYMGSEGWAQDVSE